MKKDVTLVILAAGMGSRFGGLKQLASFGPSGEFIIDYSIYDAIKAGFNKVVFIIKRENYDIFLETIGKRVEEHIKVEYAFQENNNLPYGYDIPSDRVKPLGTAHAVLCAKNNVNEPFAMINADDFYGRDAFIRAYDYLVNLDNNSVSYGMIGYQTANTLTPSGSVKRGICETDENGYLSSITESKVYKENGKIICEPLNGTDTFTVDDNAPVSMNYLLFTPTIFKYIEERFPKFFEDNKDKMDSAEFLIPEVLSDLIKGNIATTKVIPTDASWYGVTYKEDIPSVENAIRKLVKANVYKDNLWK